MSRLTSACGERQIWGTACLLDNQVYNVYFNRSAAVRPKILHYPGTWKHCLTTHPAVCEELSPRLSGIELQQALAERWARMGLPRFASGPEPTSSNSNPLPCRFDAPGGTRDLRACGHMGAGNRGPDVVGFDVAGGR